MKAALAQQGLKSGRLTLVRFAGRDKGKHQVWECLCDCGKTIVSRLDSIGESSTSCGCFSRELHSATAKKTFFKHGLSKSGSFRSWDSMIQRCTNPNQKHYARYGGRGISVCDKWASFSAFYADMGERPKGGTLGRIDNNGHYCKSNCRWETMLQQGQNRCNSRLLTFQGQSRTMQEWNRVLPDCVAPTTIHYRLSKGMTVEQALTTPARKQIGWRPQ